jgi:desert hedgehog protein
MFVYSALLGTILVNDVVASCYANVQSHKVAHIFMGPLRWYSRLARSLSISEPFGTQKVDGIHVVPRVMYEFARMVWPSMLRFI